MDLDKDIPHILTSKTLSSIACVSIYKSYFMKFLKQPSIIDKCNES